MKETKQLNQIYKTIGQRIRDIRKAKNMTLEDLCFKIDMNYSFLARIETGKAVATIESFFRIANGLGVDFFQLFNFKEIKKEKLVEDEFNNLIKSLSGKEKDRILAILNLILKK